LPALRRALSLPRSEGYSRTIIIATDGYVTVEEEAFDLIRKNLGNANMFTFGIGSGVNRYLIEGMARVGMGEPFVITKPEETREKAEKFRKMIESPVLINVRINFGKFDIYNVEPVSIPDVFAERPVIVFGKWRGKPMGEAPRSKLRGISDKAERNSAGARHPPSPKLRRGHLALPPRSKLWGIRAEASEISTTGRLSKEAIQKVIRTQISSMESCYQSALKRRSDLKGEVVLQITVDPNGRVSKVSLVSSKINDKLLEQSIIQKMKELNFPPSEKSEKVIISLLLKLKAS